MSAAGHTIMKWRQLEDLAGTSWEVGAQMVTRLN